MKDHYYCFTPAGMFWIRPNANLPDRFWLGIEDIVLRSFPSAKKAADGVYLHATGWDEWDLYDGVGPLDLSEWNEGNPN